MLWLHLKLKQECFQIVLKYFIVFKITYMAADWIFNHFEVLETYSVKIIVTWFSDSKRDFGLMIGFVGPLDTARDYT
jgi:hypothetical protein